jgi:NAD(P)-dependent dehydrogenase (short-subunit alcohol dehydrogenase family)
MTGPSFFWPPAFVSFVGRKSLTGRDVVCDFVPAGLGCFVVGCIEVPLSVVRPSAGTLGIHKDGAITISSKPAAVFNKLSHPQSGPVSFGLAPAAIADLIMNDQITISRRRVIGRLGAGLAAVAAPRMFAAETNPKAEPMVSEKLQDPTSKYPKPPFKSQSQPWPGLVAKMDPRPDHGEKTYKGSGRLAGRKALITGGDSGMGRAAAIAYAREGADVAINYFPTEQPDAEEVVTLIKDAGRKAVTVPGDLRNETFCKKMVEDAVSALVGLDIVVCNAARQQTRASILDVSTEDFDATMKTNIYAPFWIIKAALSHLQPGSCIIGTTSEQATDPSPDLYDYAQTKAATTNYVRSLAKQLAPKGIRVNGVAPGPIWTPLQVSGGATQEKLKQFGGQTPMGRPGQPAELASIYVQLAANDASYATGQVYGAAGGSGQP